jgi:hypothetical protein
MVNLLANIVGTLDKVLQPPASQPLFSLPTPPRAPDRPDVAAPTPLVASQMAQAAPGQLFTATLPPGFDATTVLSDNNVPLNSVVFSQGVYEQHDASVAKKSAIMQAILQANPDATLVMATNPHFIDLLSKNREHFGITTKSDDPTTLLAEAHKVPAKNIAYVPTTADWNWAQDPFHPIADGFGESKGQYRQGTRLADDLAKALGLMSRELAVYGAGGDMHFIKGPDGEQQVFFGPESMQGHDKQALASPKDSLKTIAAMMEGLEKEGVDPGNIKPIGGSDGTTFGQALAQLSPEERKAMDPDVLGRIESLKDVPMPTKMGENYHIDLFFRSPDGKTALVNPPPADKYGQEVVAAHKATSDQLKAYGMNVVELPTDRERYFGYTNFIQGIGKDGKPVILLPTVAEDPTKLTKSDAEAVRAIEKALPGTRVIPIGAKTAMDLSNGGPHCLTNPLPHIVKPVGSAPATH